MVFRFHRKGVLPLVCFQALAALVALAPQSYGGLAYDSVRAAIRTDDADALCRWYPLAHDYSDRDRLRHLVGYSIPKTRGRTQGILLHRLTAFRAGAVPYIPMLVKILSDPKSKNRGSVAIHLGWMGPLAKGAVEPLKLCLKSDDADLRHSACLSLWRIERRPSSIIPTLVRGLSREVAPARREMLKFVDGDGKVQIGEFTELVTEPYHMQNHMLCAIGTIGPSIRSAVWPAIARLHDSNDDHIRNMVCRLAPKFCPDQGVAARMLTAELAKTGINGNTCGNFKQLRTAGVPELSRLLHDPKTRRVALEVLTSLGKDGASAAKLVGTWTDDPDEAIRRQARAALEAFGKSEK